MGRLKGPKETGTTIKECMTADGMCYLVQSPLGVSQEGDAVSVSDTDGHGGETGGGRVPYGFCFQRCPARHRTRGVVRATGIRLQGILQNQTTTESFVRWFVPPFVVFWPTASQILLICHKRIAPQVKQTHSETGNLLLWYGKTST